MIINDVIRGQKIKEFGANCSDTLYTCQVLLFGIFLHNIYIFLIGFIWQIQKQSDNSSEINIKGEHKAGWSFSTNTAISDTKYNTGMLPSVRPSDRHKPLGMQVGLGPGQLAHPQKGGTTPQFSAHVYCGQMAGWMKMSLGMAVGSAQATLCSMGTQLPLPKKGGRAPKFRPMSIVAKQLCG